MKVLKELFLGTNNTIKPSPNIFFLLLLFFYLLWHVIYADKFLKVSLDDAFMCEPAYTFYKTGKFAVPSMRGVHKLEEYENRFGRLFLFSQIPFLAIFGPKPISVRLPPILFGMLLLVVTYVLGKKIYDHRIALYSTVLLALSGMFIVSSHYGRPDTMLALFVSLALYIYIVAIERRSQFLFFLNGLISAISTDVHLNGVMLLITFGLLLSFKYGFSFFKRRVFWFWLIGVVMGIIWWICLHVLPNPKLFFEQWRSVVIGGFSPPIFRTLNIFELVKMELERYSIWYWQTTGKRNLFELGLILFAFVYAILKRNKTENEKAVMFLTCCFLLLFMLIVSPKTCWYLIYVYPFFMFMITDAILGYKLFRKFDLKILFYVLTAFYLLNITVWSLKYKDADFNSFVDNLKRYIPPAKSVIGSLELWHGFVDYADEFYSTLTYFYHKDTYGTSLADFIKQFGVEYMVIELDERESSLFVRERDFLNDAGKVELLGEVKTKFYSVRLVTGELYKILVYKVKK